MPDSGFQIQILMADESVAGFLTDPDIEASGISVESTKAAGETATLGFDLLGTITIISAIVTGLESIFNLTAPLKRLLKNSQRPVVVSTAFGTITLDPKQPLSDDEMRKLLSTLATL